MLSTVIVELIVDECSTRSDEELAVVRDLLSQIDTPLIEISSLERVVLRLYDPGEREASRDLQELCDWEEVFGGSFVSGLRIRDKLGDLA